MQGLFITFEGIDGSGKSTLAAMLHEHLLAMGKNAVLFRDPGSTPIGEKIRSILKDVNNSAMSAKCEALLFLAARAQGFKEVIAPHCRRGGIVIADRFSDSTMVYQGYASGLDVSDLTAIDDFAAAIVPDITFFISVTPEVGLSRKSNQGKLDRIEEKGLEYQQKVADGYEMLAKRYPYRIITINGCQSIEQSFAEILRHVNGLLLAIKQNAPGLP